MNLLRASHAGLALSRLHAAIRMTRAIPTGGRLRVAPQADGGPSAAVMTPHGCCHPKWAGEYEHLGLVPTDLGVREYS
jgi:hypothetical protein